MKNIRRIGLPIVAAFLFQTSAFSQVKPLIELVEIPANASASGYVHSDGKTGVITVISADPADAAKNADVVELIKHTIGKYGVSDSNAVITF